MAGEMKSNTGEAVSHAEQLKGGGEPAHLDGVDDDNTLAESGIYNTYHRLKGIYSSAMGCLRADAADLANAAWAIEAADATSALKFG